MAWTQVCYQYDGSFAGFLSCVFDSYVNREAPAEFRTPDDPCCSLYPLRTVEPDEAHAKRVYRSLSQKIGPRGQKAVARGFLTCLPHRELWLWRFIQMGYQRGPALLHDLTDPTVDTLRRAVLHLEHEAERYKGFARFSLLDGSLVGEIEPENRVLPLLMPHFCSRYPQESLLLHDRTHHEVLIHANGRRAILPVEDFCMGAADETELAYRRMWRSFYDTISIEGRYNPRCRMNHMPKRYWGLMTEFQSDPIPAVPPCNGPEKHI